MLNRNSRRRRPTNRNSNNYGAVARRLAPLLLSPGILFPDKLAVNTVAQLTYNNTFSASAYNWSFFIVSNPATGVSTNCSGLYWLLSGSQTNGTSYAPYTLGIVRTVKFEVSAQTVLTSTGNTGAQYVFLPLAPSVNTSSLNVFNGSEAYEASRILTLPDAPNTVSVSRPQLVRTYRLHELYGIDEQTYLSNPLIYGFNYAGQIDQYQDIVLISGTQTGSTDATLTSRVTVKMTFHVILSARNTLNTLAPHA
jgi:hypothetical protein